MRVTFNELAERELNDAAQYYEREQPGLGAAFITGVRRCTEAIAEHPEAGAIVLGAIRRRLCQAISLWAPLHGCPKRTPYSRGHESQAPTWVLGRQDLTGPTNKMAMKDDASRRVLDLDPEDPAVARFRPNES